MGWVGKGGWVGCVGRGSGVGVRALGFGCSCFPSALPWFSLLVVVGFGAKIVAWFCLVCLVLRVGASSWWWLASFEAKVADWFSMVLAIVPLLVLPVSGVVLGIGLRLPIGSRWFFQLVLSLGSPAWWWYAGNCAKVADWFSLVLPIALLLVLPVGCGVLGIPLCLYL